MHNFFDLTGKVAIVTGGYGHLGLAMVEALLAYNATVIVAGRSEEKFGKAFKGYKGDKLFFKAMDAGDFVQVNNAFDEIKSEHGSIDILINNAFMAKVNKPESISDEDWAFTMEGVTGIVYKGIKAVIPVMKAQGSGKIINISSMYGMVSPDFNVYIGECERYLNPPHYGVAKAGVIQITKYFAVYLGKYNIQVNTITPGAFPSVAIQEDSAEFIKRLSQKSPLNRIGKPEDLKGVTVLLSSPASDFITGQNMVVDGGWTAL